MRLNNQSFSTLMVNLCICITLANFSLIHTDGHTLMAAIDHAKYWFDHQEQFGVQCLAQGHSCGQEELGTELI